jgi:anti-anti-sigma regulatory factor
MTVARVDTSTENGSVHISLSGEIDLTNASTVEEQIRAAVSGLPTAVSVDLTT